MPEATEGNAFGRVDKYDCILCNASIAEPATPTLAMVRLMDTVKFAFDNIQHCISANRAPKVSTVCDVRYHSPSKTVTDEHQVWQLRPCQLVSGQVEDIDQITTQSLQAEVQDARVLIRECSRAIYSCSSDGSLTMASSIQRQDTSARQLFPDLRCYDCEGKPGRPSSMVCHK